MTTSTPPPVRPGRSRARVVIPLVIAAWVVLEIWLLTVVASATSGLTVLLLLVAGFVLGGTAVRRAGSSAWRNLATMAPPGSGTTAPPVNGERSGLAMLGGLLLMIPGLLSDVAALVLLFPPTRKLVGRLADRTAARALRHHGAFPPPGFPPPRDTPTPPSADGKVIPGEVIHRK